MSWANVVAADGPRIFESKGDSLMTSTKGMDYSLSAVKARLAAHGTILRAYREAQEGLYADLRAAIDTHGLGMQEAADLAGVSRDTANRAVNMAEAPTGGLLTVSAGDVTLTMRPVVDSGPRRGDVVRDGVDIGAVFTGAHKEGPYRAKVGQTIGRGANAREALQRLAEMLAKAP